MTSTTEQSSNTWIVLRAFGSKIPNPESLCTLVALLAEEQLEPDQYWTVDGAPALRYTPEAFGADAPSIYESGSVYLRRSDGTEAEVAAGFRPRVSVWRRNSDVSSETIATWLRVSERIRDTLAPEFLVVGFGGLGPRDERNKPTWTTEHELAQQLIVKASWAAPKDYFRHGPLGLGLRTYIGPHFADLFGRERLLSLPGVATECPLGGVNVDVADNLATASSGNLITSWQECMRHLEAANVFAIPAIDGHKKRIRFVRRGDRCVMPPPPAAKANSVRPH